MELLLLLPLASLCAIATAGGPYQVLFVRSPCQEVSESVAETAEQRANELLEGSDFNISVSRYSEFSCSSVLDAVVEVLYSPPVAELAILFAGCANDTETVAEIANSELVNITLFTYGFPSVPSSNSPLSRHFRLVPSGSYLALGISAFIKEFEWSRAVIISEGLPVFAEIADALNNSLIVASVNVTALLLPSTQRTIQFPRDNRIFILNMSPAAARAVLCEAALQNLSHPGYVWVSYGWYQDQWWEERLLSSTDNCTDSDIEAILEGAVAISHLPTGEQPSWISGNVFSLYAGYAVDAVLAIAHAINGTGSTSGLNTALEQSYFIGESGSVSFNNRIRTPSRITIQQYRKDGNATLRRYSVAYTRPQTGDSNLTFLPGEGALTLWPSLEGAVPLDGTPLIHENFPHIPLVVVCYVLASAGIVFAVFCFFFNIIFRNKKLIRLTSPNLNYITIIGAIVFYSAVYTFFYIEGTSPALKEITCFFRMWLTSLGYTICYVPINAKMWRVYHICHRPKPSMKNSFLKDWHLILMVLFFVVVDVIMLTAVTAIAEARYFVRTIPDKEHTETIVNEDGYSVEFVVQRCFSPTEPIWLSFVIGYKIILQGIGCFLAFNIRKVKIKGLNDSKEVSAILYVTFILIAALIIVTFIYGDYVNIDGGTYGLGIIAATTVVLTFIFIPKMYWLYRDPEGKMIFEGPSAVDSRAGARNSNNTSGTDVANEETVSYLKKRIKELESKLNSNSNGGSQNGNTSLEMDDKNPPSSQLE